MQAFLFALLSACCFPCAAATNTSAYPQPLATGPSAKQVAAAAAYNAESLLAANASLKALKTTDKIITVGNKTYLGCAEKGFRTCSQALFGNTRINCYTDIVVIDDSSGVEVKLPAACGCDAGMLFSNEHSPPGGECDPMSTEIRCLYSKGGYPSCTYRNVGMSAFNIIFAFINLSFEFPLLFFAIYMFASLIKKKQPVTNATGSTMFFAILGLIFLVFWTVYYLQVPIGGDSTAVSILSLSVGIPGSATFAGISFMNLALMWMQVAASSKTLRKGKSNLGKGPTVLVVTFSCLFGIIEVVCFGIIDNKTIGSAVALLFIIAIMISYLVGSAKLASALAGAGVGSKKSPRIMRIVVTGRRVAYALIGFIMFNVIYAVTTVLKSHHKVWAQWLNVPMIAFIIMSINVAYIYELRYLRDSTARVRGVAVKQDLNATTSANTTTVSSSIVKISNKVKPMDT